MNPPNKTKVSEKVKDAIEEMIFSKMHAGDKLPAEGELAEMLAVSRTTVREALKGLEASKIVEKRNGGTFIVEKVRGCFVDPLCIMIQLNTIKQSEIMDVRILLETEAAGQAAVNAEPEQVRELENTVWLMKKPGIQIEEYIDLDVKFHFMIAKASSNQMLYQLIRDISTVIVRFYPRCCTLEIAEKIAIPQLVKVVDAIKSKDAGAARDSMRQHLQECDEIIRK
ncbi:MAG: FadR family transcriptional regulator [Clostridiaceae bacterium]|nr:FadR family transcriptional regulator [Clostridiaceae bacterium]